MIEAYLDLLNFASKKGLIINVNDGGEDYKNCTVECAKKAINAVDEATVELIDINKVRSGHVILEEWDGR
tara:strand:- start:2949 stop:3158 length:210 start_codon:yes stop_codon:yes gene_type:complete